MRIGFVRLWTGSTASGLATWALPFVLGLAVLDASLSAGELGVALAFRTLGFLAAVPVSGVLADRSGRRKTVLWASIAAAAGIPLIVASLSVTGVLAFGLLLSGAAIAGIGQGACRPAYQALMPLVVNRDGLQAANAAMSISVRVSNLVGPALATATAMAFGVSASLFAIFVLWVVSAFAPPFPPEIVATTAHSEERGNPLRRFVAELREGLDEARLHPWFIAGLGALTAVIATGYSVTGVLLPAISRDVFDGPELLVAAAMAYTFGALCGALIMARWRPLNQGWWALGGLALYCLVPLSLLVPVHIAIPIAAFYLAGVGIELFNVPWFTAIQREVRPERLARVSSLDFMLSYGLAPLGLAAIAPLSQQLGTLSILAAYALVCLFAPIVAMFPASSRTFSTRSTLMQGKERSNR